MRVAIIGSRELTYSGKGDVQRYVKENLGDDDVVISGGARGTDRLAERTATSLDIPVVSFRPYNTGVGDKPWAVNRVIWDPFAGLLEQETTFTLPQRYPGFAAAAFVRNGYIVEWAERAVVFWDGYSKGTKDTLRKAQAAFGVKGVELFRVEEPGLNRKAVT